MLFQNKLSQTLNFGADPATLAIHPILPIMANDQGTHLMVTNFRLGNLTQTMNLNETPASL
jgi:hypothetical protein